MNSVFHGKDLHALSASSRSHIYLYWATLNVYSTTLSQNA